jgi:hypothetical protein
MDDHLKPLALGRTGYEAYAAFRDGKTWDGRDMPAWEDLGEIQSAWAMAAGAIYRAVLTPPGGGR